MISNPRLWITFAAIVLLFAMTGPFGTYVRLDFIPRLGYWLVVQSGAWLIALFCISASVALLEDRIRSLNGRVTAGAAFASIPISIFVMATNQFLFGLPFNLPELARNVVFSVPIAVAFGLITRLAVSASLSGEPVADDNEAAPSVPLLRRLPVEKRGPLLRISVQDHYTEIVTSRGSHLVLMRFADALDELGTEQGRQVHRSHWVANTAVVRLKRNDGKLTVITRDEAEIPVSRTFAPDVRQAWGS